LGGSDCPIFDNVWKYSAQVGGSSIDAADLIVADYADLVVNWNGGLHHAKKKCASGFCYVNDIVLCILELLKYKNVPAALNGFLKDISGSCMWTSTCIMGTGLKRPF
jgi:acetoin utilization deacetylase AcuC-like enzyme